MAPATSTSQPAVARIRQPSGLTTHLAQTGKPGADPQFAEPANRKQPRSARRSLTEPEAGIRRWTTEWNKHARHSPGQGRRRDP